MRAVAAADAEVGRRRRALALPPDHPLPLQRAGQGRPEGVPARPSRAAPAARLSRVRARCRPETSGLNLCPAGCRAAFDFAYGSAEAPGASRSGTVEASAGSAAPRQGLLGRLLGGWADAPAPPALPARDMRALNGLARILRTVGVLN